MSWLIPWRFGSWRSLRRMQLGQECFFIPMRQMSCKPFPILTTKARVKRELTVHAFTWTLRRRNVAISLSRQLSSKARDKSRTSFFHGSWRVLRVLFIATGGLFWGIAGVILVARKIGLIKSLNPANFIDPVRMKTVQHLMAVIYQFEPSERGEQPFPMGTWVDVRLKMDAAKIVLQKIQSEDAFVEIFGGHPVVEFFCRSRVGSGNTELTSGDHTSSKDEWNVCYYLDGPKSSGFLTLKFQRGNDAWIPVYLQLERVTGQSIELITSVSAPLPDGLTKFTHLMHGC